MIRMNQIKIRAGKEKEKYNPEYKAVPEWERKLLESKIRKQLRLKEKDTFTFEIIKRSIDARKKPDIFYSYTVDVDGLKERDVIRRVKEGSLYVQIRHLCTKTDLPAVRKNNLPHILYNLS